MKEIIVQYDNTFDELNIRFDDELNTSSIIKLDNNVIIEFDEKENVNNIVLPNFQKMLNRLIQDNDIFVFKNISFEGQNATLQLLWNDRPINISLTL